MTVARVLENVWGVKSKAAACLISHGQVKIDGVPVTDPKQPAEGQWLTMFGRVSRLSWRACDMPQAVGFPGDDREALLCP